MAAWFRSSTMNTRSIDSSTNNPRSARPYIPSDVNGNVEAMMIDMLINEIQMHISRLENEHENRRKEQLENAKAPDYSWLMDWSLKTKKNLGFRECAAIEMMCQKIKPNEWGNLIREWRTRIRYVESRDEVLGVFRGVVDDVINERCSSRTSIRLVDELAQSDDQSNLQDTQSARMASTTSRHPSPVPNHRSTSVSELSVPALFRKQFNNMHEIV